MNANRTNNAAPSSQLPATSRSRITNGSQLLPGVSGRTVWARVLRDNLDALLTHVGGADRASEPERMTARRAAALEAELLHLEAKFAKLRDEGGEPTAADLDLYGRLANGQRRHLEALGMQRRPRDVVPDLQQYVGKAA